MLQQIEDIFRTIPETMPIGKIIKVMIEFTHN